MTYRPSFAVSAQQHELNARPLVVDPTDPRRMAVTLNLFPRQVVVDPTDPRLLAVMVVPTGPRMHLTYVRHQLHLQPNEGVEVFAMLASVLRPRGDLRQLGRHLLNNLVAPTELRVRTVNHPA